MDRIDQQELENFLIKALDEDVKDGDHTSLACVPASAKGKAKLLVKAPGILAGVAIAEPWRGGAPGLSRPPPHGGKLLESILGDGQHPFV